MRAGEGGWSDFVCTFRVVIESLRLLKRAAKQ